MNSFRANYFAHTGNCLDRSDWHELKLHLTVVADQAAERGRDARPDDLSIEAANLAAGLLHDIGKYREEFQIKLDFESRGQLPPVPREKTFHKQAGAAKAAFANHLPVAFAIAGHHGGMPDRNDLLSMVQGANGRTVADAIWPIAAANLPELAHLVLEPPAAQNRLQVELMTRVVFSCLVDADWADTSAHQRRVEGLPVEPPPRALNPESWLKRVLQVIDTKAAACRDKTVKRARADVLAACLDAAEQPPGLFSLTVPTGGGKTLSALAFALKHAARHGLRRVIYVAPYLSILDQNADAMREALGFARAASEVLEHHSLAEPPGDENQDETERAAAARRAENWDAPIVITTSVQFFESLFSNKPSRCRKLHNIARSVVLLDECQSLPPCLAAPTCGMLKQVVEQLGSTIVFCTATQPAFDHDDLQDHERLHAVEIAPAQLKLFERLKRVELAWPTASDEALSWREVADQMLRFTPTARPAALCIVNTRRAARELFRELQRQQNKGVFHLSTGMCPAHRVAVLDEVCTRLNGQLPCFLVSTQLIEAGVDVDFPLVMREMGPLEAVIQAAGRCNREGLLNSADGSPGGRVVVFRSQAAVAEPKKYFPPDKWYKSGRSTLETSFLAAGRAPSIDEPQDIREYFNRLYRSGDLDPYEIQKLRTNFQFETIAKTYRLIDDDGEAVVIGTWDAERDRIQNLLKTLRGDPSRANFRKLAPFQVNLRRHELAKADAVVAELDDRINLRIWYGQYDADLGLSLEATDSLLLV